MKQPTEGTRILLREWAEDRELLRLAVDALLGRPGSADIGTDAGAIVAAWEVVNQGLAEAARQYAIEAGGGAPVAPETGTDGNE